MRKRIYDYFFLSDKSLTNEDDAESEEPSSEEEEDVENDQTEPDVRVIILQLAYIFVFRNHS